MKILFNGDDDGLKQAVAFANGLNANTGFWDEVSRKAPPFTYTEVPPTQVAARIRSSTKALTIRLWTPTFVKRPFYRNTVAFFDADDPDKLFYHTEFLGNSTGEKVNTVVHEYVHAIDDEGDFGHGDNSPDGKEDTVPYWIGNLAEKKFNLQAGLGGTFKGVDLTHGPSKAADGHVV